MEDIQEVQMSDAESGSIQAEAAPSHTDDVPNPNNDPKGVAFGKALAAEREKIRKEIEAEHKETYKDFDSYKKAAEYLQKTSGINDLMTLREEIELTELQERAERENVSPEIQRRLEELEAKSAKADQLEQHQKEQAEWNSFESSLKTFCEGKEIDGKPVDHKELWAYMHENGTSKPEIAFKAMRHDALEKQVESAEKEGVKKFLQAKGGIPTIPGKTATGQTVSAAPKTFAEARQRAMQRLTSE